MKHRMVATTIAAIDVLVLLAATGCGSAASPAEGAAPPGAPASVIAAAGSTFAAPLMSAWIGAYQHAHPDRVVNYRAIGSGGGIEEFKKGMLSFAASDAPLSDNQIKDLPPTIQIPGTAGPVCIIYNLPGLERPLRLSPKALAGIYLGAIINWQDPAIVSDNPGVKLPRAAVIAIHRSDGSGTTSILTTYLSKISPEWSRKPGPGLSVPWPVGLGADGSQGVLEIVKQSPGTIGYLELNYAKENKVPIASIQNRAGAYVDPTPDSTAAAIEAFQADLARDMRAPIVDPPASAKSAYPIAGFTFLLVPKDHANRSEQMSAKDFIAYALSAGQDSAEQLSYTKLPPPVQQEARALLTQLTANGQPLN